MNEIGASGLINEAQLLNEDVAFFMGHCFCDPLFENWADFGRIQHARIIDRQWRLLTLKKQPIVDHGRVISFRELPRFLLWRPSASAPHRMLPVFQVHGVQR
jgi:hypothetical protein